MPDHAKAVATYDHPFFGKWPAITENQFGSGTLLYEGTYLSEPLQKAVLRQSLAAVGLTGADQQLASGVHVTHNENRIGKRIHYYFNYSAAEVRPAYTHEAGTNLLDGKAIAKGGVLII